MALITETNQQYYQGAQPFLAVALQKDFITTFDTDLVFGSDDPTETNYALNNFKLYKSETGLPGSFQEVTSGYSVENNTIIFTNAPFDDTPSTPYIVVQLKSLSGGNYGNEDAFGQTVEENYGGYEYISLNDAIDNFMVGYVGDGKILQRVDKSDVLFFAKRSLQEFSYDTLKSIHSQELTVPPSLSLPLPQDYVNYVRVSRIDELGIKRIIYPVNNLTINPYNNPVQDTAGVPTQDNFGNNIEGTSITEERWAKANLDLLNFNLLNNFNDFAYWWNLYGFDGNFNTGRLYGLDPQTSQINGWFSMNYREGKISFSNELVNKLIVLEYISDGLGTDLDTKVPKLAEDALYASILYNIVSVRANQDPNNVMRLKRDRSAKLRNAKIRLSNIKLDEIVQVMRGKSKWIKH
tara:strand:- start:5904 stop:7127 length:1224 start_codon:yes stop_codon:yes gene_type:complete